jgi:long-subunit acyl-CoA synthetase (AMP-forming)
MLSYLPLAHVFERTAVEMLSIKASMRLYFAESLDTFVADMKRARPTLFHSVPRLWLKFKLGVNAKMPDKKLKTLLKIPILSGIVKRKVLTGLGLDQTRLAVTGSAPVPPELIAWYRSLGLELLEGYGMTEDFCCSHLGGDRGEYDAQGRLRITGRAKELFKSSKGKYIAPAPIENLLNAHSHIELSCVTGAGLSQPVAIVQLAEALRKAPGDRAAMEKAIAELLSSVNAQVEEWEQLACIVVATEEWQIENGFLTPTMKLKRSKIDDHYGQHLTTWIDQKREVIWS